MLLLSARARDSPNWLSDFVGVSFIVYADSSRLLENRQIRLWFLIEKIGLYCPVVQFESRSVTGQFESVHNFSLALEAK
jgi:hypothetical protein